jgi:hypothetical protein
MGIRHFTYAMCDINFTAGPFCIDLHRDDPGGDAARRLEKSTVLSDKIFHTVEAVTRSRKRAFGACVRVNMLLESEMDALLADADLLERWCTVRIAHYKSQ